jgi:subtilisin-like proprotein convertase family protein
MKNQILFLLFILILFTTHSVFSQPQNTICRNGLNIVIIDHGTTRDSLSVNLGAGCQVLDVNIILDTIRHTWLADLRIYIQKSGVGVMVIDHVGGSGDDFINVILDDSASLPPANLPITGRFRPSNPLTPFNGLFTDGTWKILITDTAGGDTGVLRAWCVQLVFQCPTGIINTAEIPNNYRLYQNYPNPFNPVTTIRYGIPVSGNVKLAVYDIEGNEVAVPVNGFREAKIYETEFDASGFASGVYFYKLSSGNFTETKKMLLVK